MLYVVNDWEKENIKKSPGKTVIDRSPNNFKILLIEIFLFTICGF
jgi:hypothetical protein